MYTLIEVITHLLISKIGKNYPSLPTKLYKTEYRNAAELFSFVIK